MADPTGGSFLGLEKVVEWLWAVVLFVIGWFWKNTHKELKELRDGKANQNEVDKQRVMIEKLGTKIDAHGDSLARIETKLDMLPRRRTDYE